MIMYQVSNSNELVSGVEPLTYIVTLHTVYMHEWFDVACRSASRSSYHIEKIIIRKVLDKEKVRFKGLYVCTKKKKDG
jgi:hypothetical protein